MLYVNSIYIGTSMLLSWLQVACSTPRLGFISSYLLYFLFIPFHLSLASYSFLFIPSSVLYFYSLKSFKLCDGSYCNGSIIFKIMVMNIRYMNFIRSYLFHSHDLIFKKSEKFPINTGKHWNLLIGCKYLCIPVLC